jgi:ABC-type multidrug transport system fused ATPase/permease subunit
VTLRSLRKQISVVTQDPVVFAMTLGENIAYGARNRDDERIRQAARQAHADEFIRAKPGGYDEVAGERGATLSGGAASTVVHRPGDFSRRPILIFDEATSQIDSESERKIQDAIGEIAAGKTTMLIAHRLSTIPLRPAHHRDGCRPGPRQRHARRAARSLPDLRHALPHAVA